MMFLRFGQDEIAVPAPCTRLGLLLFPFHRFFSGVNIFAARVV